jgi:glycosyltransferase involved in cell wall biosynthesis
MDEYRVALVIPSFNEDNTIAEVVAKASSYGVVIVVDDGSTDETANIAKEAGAIVVIHSMNLGYEAALNSGFKQASELDFDGVVTLDADGQHDPQLISLFLQKIMKGNDLVLGVRNKIPRFSEYFFALYSRSKFGIKDPLCGMKAYNIAVYRDMGYFDSYQSVGSELAFYAVLKGYQYTQVELNVRDRIDESRYGNIVRANIRILKALFASIKRFW